MSLFHRHFWIVALGLIVASQVNAGELIAPDKVVWGRYCGECVGNCSTMREIDHTGLRIDQSDQFLRAGPFQYEFNGTPEPAAEFDKYIWLLREPMPLRLNVDRIIFGQPDAYDQCGFYVEFSTGGSSYRILVDPDKVPPELADFVGKLFGHVR